VLIGAAAVLLVLIALLAIPVTLRFNISWHGMLHQDVRVDWAFGLVRVRVAAPRAKGKGDARSESKAKKRASPSRAHQKRKGRNKPDVLAALRLRKFRLRIARFMRSFWRAFHKDDVKLRVRIGLEDPAETGQLWGLIGPLAALLTIVREISVSVVPEFREATFELDTSGKIRVIPGRLVVIVGSLLLCPSFWQGMKTLRGAA
jgi:hypothetical protein